MNKQPLKWLNVYVDESKIIAATDKSTLISVPLKTPGWGVWILNSQIKHSTYDPNVLKVGLCTSFEYQIKNNEMVQTMMGSDLFKVFVPKDSYTNSK